MATQAHAAQAVPQLWQAARARGHASPDWPVAARPAQCRLADAGYLAFLEDHATDTTTEISDGMVAAMAPAGSVLAA